ncbi:MAG: hypothetical protein EA409_00535 [Saprospirales bacterium]|nr:MAG: hypothetical protein EA409_00535 [Saprospirales bacterium]
MNIRIHLTILAAIFFFSIASTAVFSQQIPGEDGGLWRTLGKLSYEKQYNDMFGFEIDMPVFSEEIKALENKEVMVRGYIIPVEGYRNHKEFIFSAFPYSQCFFCGAAGPETVMEIYAERPVRFTSEIIWLKGKLILNDSDINHLFYILEDAREVPDPRN